MMNKVRLAVALVAALCATPAAARPKVGAPAPDFAVETFDGERMSLSAMRGQVVVLNLWATWCGPCRAELPMLSEYHRLRRKDGLRVLALTTEDSLPASKLRPLAAVVSFPMVRRMRGPYATLGAVPTTYIVDRAGVLRYAKAAALTLDDLNRLLVPLLNEPAPETLAARD